MEVTKIDNGLQETGTCPKAKTTESIPIPKNNATTGDNNEPSKVLFLVFIDFLSAHCTRSTSVQYI